MNLGLKPGVGVLELIPLSFLRNNNDTFSGQLSHERGTQYRMGGWYESWTGLWTGRTRYCEFGSTKLGEQVLRCSYVTLCKTEFTLLAMHRASLASNSRAFAQSTAVIHDPPFFILPPSSTVKQGRRDSRRDYNFNGFIIYYNF